MSELEQAPKKVDRPKPLRVSVAEAIEDMIIHGVLQPGARLGEEPLAQQLGVSRLPVREALQRLAADGFVDLRQGRSAVVHTPVADEVDDIFAVRRVLEAEGARQAAVRITDEDVDRLRGICDLGNREVTGGADKATLVELNRTFHGTVTAIAGNKVLAGMLTSLEKKIAWCFSEVVIERAPASWREHADIVAALADRDAGEAERRMHAHLSKTRALLDARFGSPR
ncbi:GntR family transcriptional regulator [Streptomyces sp. MAR4 CNX-425]|uniref:GntR family transcriptional regulator n=1 Tax=Streptomyces sp. MAR4 CNX-425 TaxID=3406343 RepID=UPI003B503203